MPEILVPGLNEIAGGNDVTETLGVDSIVETVVNVATVVLGNVVSLTVSESVGDVMVDGGDVVAIKIVGIASVEVVVDVTVVVSVLIVSTLLVNGDDSSVAVLGSVVSLIVVEGVVVKITADVVLGVVWVVVIAMINEEGTSAAVDEVVTVGIIVDVFGVEIIAVISVVFVV